MNHLDSPLGGVRLRSYVLTAAELLKSSHYHGIVETDEATILLSTDVMIDPYIFSQAADIFRFELNRLMKEAKNVSQ